MPAERRSGKSKRLGRLCALSHRPKHPPNANTNHGHRLRSQFLTSTTVSFTPLQSLFEAVPELGFCIGEGFPEGWRSELDAIQHSIGLEMPLMNVFVGLSECDEAFNDLRDVVVPAYIDWLQTAEPLPSRDPAPAPVPRIPFRESNSISKRLSPPPSIRLLRL
ncbi:hypothetical protein BDN72DRAFT_848907 [Pluteus cervinus]|uniref:Uncharacterized protein n=1 Tax=Pluteus cervinus TaxID=181527 RepID=A0ACD3AA72_9AGAR|nr:hypothetical protein BDN72DRAFT_848907 [Pluteus cervinus]